MATRSRILAWEISLPEEPGTLQTMGSQRVRHDLATKQLPSAMSAAFSIKLLFLALTPPLCIYYVCFIYICIIMYVTRNNISLDSVTILF